MKRVDTAYEKYLCERLSEILAIIFSSTKHIDHDILKFNSEKRYSMYIHAQDILKVRSYVKAIQEGKL